MSESIDVHAKERAAREAGATEGQRDEGVYSPKSEKQATRHVRALAALGLVHCARRAEGRTKGGAERRLSEAPGGSTANYVENARRVIHNTYQQHLQKSPGSS